MKNLLLLFLLNGFTLFANGINLNDLHNKLKGDGLQGWMHGSVPHWNYYVFTYRDPSDFFTHYEFPITATETKLRDELAKLNRHDEVLLKGDFINNGAPVKHIRLSALKIIKKFVPPFPTPKYEYKANLPEELLTKTSLIGKVHALVDEGRILVVEYKDAVIPVFVNTPKLVAGLYRNDKIELHYKIRKNRPLHLSLNEAVSSPVRVKERVVDKHEKAADLTGNLVLFPQSPGIRFNVFALQVTDADGVKREFTLINFDDAKIFAAIREKMQEIWDANRASAKNARNKYINPKVCMRAKGVFNIVDPSQANPQILLEAEADIYRVDCK